MLLLKLMKDAVANKDRANSKRHMEAFSQQADALMNDFIHFKEAKSHVSETFCYWNKIVKMVDLLRDLV